MSSVDNINVVVALGPTSNDTFYIGVGRQTCHNNLPPALAKRIDSGQMLNNRMHYLSLDKGAQYWCSEDKNGTLSWEAPNGGPLTKHIRQLSVGGYVTFPDYDDSQPVSQPYYFAASRTAGNWSASLPDYYVNLMNEIKPYVPNFDKELKWAIFGKGGTHIYQFSKGYLWELCGEHKDPEHPLNKVIREYDSDHNPSLSPGEWMLDRGSSISLHDHRYFFLKFRNTRNGNCDFKFCLPDHLEEKLQSMIDLSKTPAEQQAIAMDNQVRLVKKMHQMRAVVRREYEIDYSFDGSGWVIDDKRSWF
ncbi:hypothetical protein BJ165DRAFT_1408493 [Panaeolus papilionaceus]|nr:hypothetical protein BJ165DRAFT_1408493 [Panaeolus papilionaceus]